MVLAAGVSVITDNLSAVVDPIGDRRLCSAGAGDVCKLAVLI